MTHHIQLPPIGTFDAWRQAARQYALAGTPAHELSWGIEEKKDLFATTAKPVSTPQTAKAFNVPKSFLSLAQAALCHSDPARFDLIYMLLLRVIEKPSVIFDPSDPLVGKLSAMQKSVRRDSHKMTAFVRFREVDSNGRRRSFAAWFEPEHFIVERTAPFFARRFADMDWIIATPALTARFADEDITLEVTTKRPPKLEDGTDALWKAYYSNIFNPARLKTKAMMAEMPKKYWKNLPEAELIPGLIAGAPARVSAMREAQPTLPPVRAKGAVAPVAVPEEREIYVTLSELKEAASHCQRCPLGAKATQTVFGEGVQTAELVFVGEQPGDQEDLSGRPFIGPAGRLFDAALSEAGVDRQNAYVTNAVKHFKYVPKGKRRLHQRPNAGEVMACKWWLDKELKLVKPKLIVALGATAASALTGKGEAVTARRGSVEHMPTGEPVFLTVHPSSILRIPGRQAAEEARLRFVDDMRSIKALLAA